MCWGSSRRWLWIVRWRKVKANKDLFWYTHLHTRTLTHTHTGKQRLVLVSRCQESAIWMNRVSTWGLLWCICDSLGCTLNSLKQMCDSDEWVWRAFESIWVSFFCENGIQLGVRQTHPRKCGTLVSEYGALLSAYGSLLNASGALLKEQGKPSWRECHVGLWRALLSHGAAL